MTPPVAAEILERLDRVLATLPDECKLLSDVLAKTLAHDDFVALKALLWGIGGHAAAGRELRAIEQLITGAKMSHDDEATNILRRFIRVATPLDRTQLRHLTKSARTLDPEDLRRLAREVHDLPVPQHLIRYRAPGQPPVSTVEELRGLARSIITYGGPDAVRRDADPLLVETLHGMGWPT